jgi:hypothetical protein
MMSKERELLKKALDFMLDAGANLNPLFKEINDNLLDQPEQDLREGLREDIREGITLRDHFAGLAMQGLVVSRPTWEDTRRIALTSYEQADAMLAERGKRDD